MSKSFVIAFLCLIGLTGCAKQSQPISYEQPTPKTSAAIAQKAQRDGVMSSEDYLHSEELGKKVRHEKRLDDADIDWAVATMNKPSTAAWSVHTQMMALFLDMKTFTPSQREKIRVAVTPLLASKDPLDQKYAKAVIKRIS